MKRQSLIKQFSILIILSVFFNERIYAQQQEKFQDWDFRGNIGRFLKSNQSAEDNKQRNMGEAYYLKFANENSYFLRIPFKDKPITTDFIALETDSSGNCYKGSIVHINKNKDGYCYLDTVIISTLRRDKNWTIYRNDGRKFENKNPPEEKALDPVMAVASGNGKWYLYLNIFAILNPATIEPMLYYDGFGVKPTGGTSGGFGTYSLYFDANLDRNNYLPPTPIKVEFERPENLKPINL